MLFRSADYLEAGRLQLFTVDSIDRETVSQTDASPYDRVRRHETWVSYLTEELIPQIREINGTGRP